MFRTCERQNEENNDRKNVIEYIYEHQYAKMDGWISQQVWLVAL